MFKRNSIFGWQSVLHNYGWKGILLDSIYPILISSILCGIMYCNDIDIYFQLKHLLGIGITVLPTLVALIVTAYTIMISFIIGDKFISIKATKAGKGLIEGLNSGFATCLFVSTIAIITMIVVSSVANMEISVEYFKSINYTVFFCIAYLLLYSIFILIGIVIDIFNCGQTVLLDKPKDEK